jgi:predicted nucleotidyltransferase
MRLPVPDALAGEAAAIAAWARGEPLIRKVIVFGSRLRQTNRSDSDLDLAVSIAAPGADEVLLNWMDHQARWEQELTARLSMTVDLDIADPIVAPHVWSYFQAGHALIYVACDKIAT